MRKSNSTRYVRSRLADDALDELCFLRSHALPGKELEMIVRFGVWITSQKRVYCLSNVI